jgi:dUTP pyrophosphatase
LFIAAARQWMSAIGRPAVDGRRATAHQAVMNATVVTFIRLSHADGLDLPAYATEGAAGMDIRAAVPDDVPFVLAPGERAAVPTGFVMVVPDGFEGQIRPRSGLAVRHGVTCLNTPGTIDSDYRGEVHVLLINLGHDVFEITRGMRIAQIVIAPAVRAAPAETTEPPDATGRGAGGFGSTGTH